MGKGRVWRGEKYRMSFLLLCCRRRRACQGGNGKLEHREKGKFEKEQHEWMENSCSELVTV